MKTIKWLTIMSLMVTLSINSYSLIELELLEDHNRNILGEPNVKTNKKQGNIKTKNTQKIEEDEIKIENIDTESKRDENIENKKVEGVLLKDIVDVYEKRVDGKLVYRGDSTVPFTGIFGYVSLDKVQFYETYVDGLLDGETVWFSENGIKMVSENYKKSKLNGEQRSYYENGKLKSIVNYSNDKIDGVVFYDKNGKEKYKSIFKNGTGNWKYYWTNGNLFEEGKYVNYKKDGVWKRYTESGKVDTVYEYKNGRLIKERWE